MTRKIDFKKDLKHLYQPRADAFEEVDVPEMRFVMIDGIGDPNTAAAYREAVEWLYSSSYAMKFAAKTALERDYVVPPLEGLWWADNPDDFVQRNKHKWKWTMQIMVPDFVTEEMFVAARDKAMTKLGQPPESLRLAALHEGRCLQRLHIGSYDAEGPVLAALHEQIMPERGLTFNGPHHEIYLSDPRRVAPERLKTVLRQPVKQI